MLASFPGFEFPAIDPNKALEITHGNHPRFVRLARTFQCLAVPRQPLKLWETLEMSVLKRLAAGVQLPPWALKSLTFNNLPIIVNAIHRGDILVSMKANRVNTRASTDAKSCQDVDSVI